MDTTGWLRGLQVTAGGTGVVSHAGVAPLRAPADYTGLTGGLSEALASERLLAHDRGRVLAELASAIADGGEAVSDFRVIGDQEDLFGPAASVPACWRTAARRRPGGSPRRRTRPAATRGPGSRPGTVPCPACESRARSWTA